MNKWRAIVFIGGCDSGWYEAEVLQWLHKPSVNSEMFPNDNGWGALDVGAVIHTWVDRTETPHVYAIFDDDPFFYQWLSPTQYADRAAFDKAARRFWKERRAADKEERKQRDLVTA